MGNLRAFVAIFLVVAVLNAVVVIVVDVAVYMKNLSMTQTFGNSRHFHWFKV